MDGLISTMSGGMHVSQAEYDLEAFKASLATTIPSSPSQSSSNGYESPSTRPSSLSLSTYYPYETYNEDAELAAAFAGDAFAPMWQKANDNDPWRAFHQTQTQNNNTQHFQLSVNLQNNQVQVAQSQTQAQVATPQAK